MGMRIRLCDADRERFGCGEWLDFDLDAVTNGEAVTLQAAFGFSYLQDLADAFNAQFQPEPGGGRRRRDYDAWDSVVWIALRQAGALSARTRAQLAAELAELAYRAIGIAITADPAAAEPDPDATPAPGASGGKDDAPGAASPA